MKYLKLKGQELRCIDNLPPGLLFDLAEGAVEGQSLKAVTTFSKFLRAVVRPDDRDRLEAILYDSEDVCSIEDLNEAAGALVMEYTGRPSPQPSALPNGSMPTGGPSKVVSLSPVMDKAEAPLPKAGRRNAS